MSGEARAEWVGRGAARAVSRRVGVLAEAVVDVQVVGLCFLGLCRCHSVEYVHNLLGKKHSVFAF